MTKYNHARDYRAITNYTGIAPLTIPQLNTVLSNLPGGGSSSDRKAAGLVSNLMYSGMVEDHAVAEPAVDYLPNEDRTHWAPGDVVRCISPYLPGTKGKDYVSKCYGVAGQEYTISGYCGGGTYKQTCDVMFEGGGAGARTRFTLVRKAKPVFFQPGFPLGTTVYLRDQEKYSGKYKGPMIVYQPAWQWSLGCCVFARPEGKPFDHAFSTNELTTEAPLVTVYGFTEGETVYVVDYDGAGIFGGPLTVTKRQHSDDIAGRSCYPTVIAATAKGDEGGFSPVNLSRTPPKPKTIPIDRPVRTKDVEAGDILRWCGADTHSHFTKEGMLTLGKEYVVKAGLMIDYDKARNGIKAGHWGGRSIMTGWSFVRRPFKQGDIVQSKTNTAWSGNMVVIEEDTRWVRCMHPVLGRGGFPHSELKRIYP